VVVVVVASGSVVDVVDVQLTPPARQHGAQVSRRNASHLRFACANVRLAILLQRRRAETAARQAPFAPVKASRAPATQVARSCLQPCVQARGLAAGANPLQPSNESANDSAKQREGILHLL
jgi:hypothetical protein